MKQKRTNKELDTDTKQTSDLDTQMSLQETWETSEAAGKETHLSLHG